MRMLLTDFMRRRWWVFVLMVLFLGVLIGPNVLVLAGAIGPVLVLLDIGRGADRVHRSLPIESALLGRTIWIEGVLLLPVLTAALQVPATACLTLLGKADADNLVDILFLNYGEVGRFAHVFVALLLNTAYASFAMLLVPLLRSRSGGIANQMKSPVHGAAVPWLLLGTSLFNRLLDHMGFAHLQRAIADYPLLLPAAGLLVLASYLDAPRPAQTRPKAPRHVQARSATSKGPSARKRARWPSGFRGIWLLEARVVCLTVAALLGILFLTELTNLGMESTRHFGAVFAAFGAMFVGLSRAFAWTGAARPLRALPVSHNRLALFLMSLPYIGMAAGVALAVVMLLALGIPQGLLLLPGVAAPAAALAMVLTTVSLRFGVQAAAVPFGILVGVCSMALGFLGPQGVPVPGPISAVALLLLTAGITFFALRELLAHSSAIYRNRTLAIQQSLGRQ